MSKFVHTLTGYRLLRKGAIVLSEIESNGICVDVPYCQNMLKRIECLKNRELKKLQDSEVGKKWKNIFGDNSNWGSAQQLANILFEHMGYISVETTATGRPSTSEEALRHIDDPAVTSFISMKRYEKIASTYLKNFINFSVDGVLHPIFNLHLAQSYRSTSDNPNFQNIPVHDPVFGPMIRKAFIPRPGRRIIELDYSQLEVRIAACLHKDPVMFEYINNPEKDMHRDMAMQLYKLPQSEVTDRIRYSAKNTFVFAVFYGSYYINCAPALWEAVNEKTASGILLRDWLAQNGIKKLGLCNPKEKPKPGTFEKHVQEVENDFWNNRFKVYNQWRKDWYSKYLDTGYIKLPTGFTCSAHMTRTQCINYPIQGSAFHCLLWSLIKIRNEIKKRKMKSMLLGQIHDSIVGDIFEEEREEYIELCYNIMTEAIREVWDWIIVPLEVEAKISEIDGNWYDMEKM